MNKKVRKNVMLYQALDEYTKAYAADLPSEEALENVTFSAAFQTAMDRLIRKQKKVYYYWTNTAAKKAACVLAVLLLLACIVTLSVGAVRETFFDFVVKTYKEFSAIRPISEENPPTLPFYISAPTYLPQGYELVEEKYYGKDFDCLYRNAQGDEIEYRQFTAGGGELRVDTEDAYIEKVYVGDREAMYYENKGNHYLLFVDEYHYYLFCGQISKDELIKMTSSIRQVEDVMKYTYHVIRE